MSRRVGKVVENLLEEKVVSSNKMALIVDAQNCYYAVRRRGCSSSKKRMYPDFGSFFSIVRDSGLGEIVLAKIFIVNALGVDQRSFVMSLKYLGYEVVEKATKEYLSGRTKGNVDVEITLSVVDMVRKGCLDWIVLVSGDSDFIELVKWVQKEGAKVWIMAYQGTLDEGLKSVADKCSIVSLDNVVRGRDIIG